MRLLIVEDEKRTAAYLEKGLTEEGFRVDVTQDGRSALELALSQAYDLLLLDVNLPQLDGWGVLTGLRRAGKTTPVLILTARDAVPDRVRGLELGADDYLVKPFAFSELVARIRTVLRRSPPRGEERLGVADLEIDPARHSARRGRRELELTAKEFSLLWLLASRPGQVLSRTVIAEQVWDMHFDGETNVVDVAVRRLRGKVDDPFDVKLIHTVRGVGYVLRSPGP